MAGLNDLVTDTKTVATSLPSWYSNAQQSAVNKALSAESPTIGQTAAQSAVNAFGTGSPFTAGSDILQQIGTGAANPWLVSTDASGKQTVSPNVNTALGGLYQSQQDYLNQMLPQIDAAPTSQAIGAGGFGSRMNMSGIANARANALADLQQKQMTNALQAQQTGVAAGSGLGNLGNQLVQSAINTGTYQENAPYASGLNLANIMAKIQAPQTTTTTDQLGALKQIMGLLSTTQGGLSSLLGSTKTINGQTIQTPGIIEQSKTLWDNLFKNSATAPSTSGITELSNPAVPGDASYGWKYYSDGTVIDPYGQYYYNGQMVYSPLDTSTDNWDLFGSTDNSLYG